MAQCSKSLCTWSALWYCCFSS